jgi:epoxyqueuosine reductase
MDSPSAMKNDSDINNRLHEPSLSDNINDWSRREGFAAFGITALNGDALSKAEERLKDYLSHQHHGTMKWMERPQREHPHKLWASAKTAIVLAANYKPEGDPLHLLKDKQKAAISVYAQTEDYHRVIGKKTKALAQKIQHHYQCEVKTFVDTAPIMEKPLGALAQVGWQGKHSNLVSKTLGSWFFLSVILLDRENNPSSAPHQDLCGSCQKCLDICPTQAFVKPYQLDSRKCISYLTIEHKGHIDRELREGFGNRIYGCDDCLAVCPWNKFALRGQRMAEFAPNPKLGAPALKDLLKLTEEDFADLFRHNPIKRIGLTRFLRNVLIACGNSADKSFLQVLEVFIQHKEPLLRVASLWAFGRLADKEQWRELKEKYQSKETDQDVLAEWDYNAR